MKKKFGVFVLAAGLLLTACGGGNGATDTSGKKDDGKTAETQVIKVASGGELSTLDSAHYTDVYSSDMIGQVVEGLYRMDKNHDPELAVAASEPTVSDDGLVYTFKLKETKWSNGDPVIAGDFVSAFKNVVDPSFGSSSSNQMDIFKNGRKIREGQAKLDELGVKAIDDQTLEMTLEYPIPYLAQVLVGTPFMPKNEKFVKEKGDAYGTSTDNFVGNGPFVISGWDGNTENWTLTKNKDYWDQKNVKLDTIDVNVVKEIGTGTNLFDAGDLDYTVLADTYALQYKDSPQAHFTPKAMVGYLSPNHKREVTGNVNVRKAILQAIDKDTFAKDILGDGSTAINGFVPKDFAKDPENGEDFRKENGDFLPFDLKAAQKSWETAKKELGKEEIELELLSADSALAKKTIEYVQGQLQQNLPGLKITLKSVPLQNRLDLQTASNFDLVFGTWTPDYADPINFLEFYDSKSGLNTAGYNNPEYDKGLNDARITLANEPEKRWDKLKELEETLIEKDAAVLPLYQGAIGYLKADKLKDLQVFPFGRTVSYRLAYVA
ncbi:pheromone-binding protein [Enterococcus sp. 7E2_DIV0204]|uniref:Pheromone-binding protein n=1 Tax=Candidatus Enterococcus lemimoniae TaxID=1834167 RepID=A0ABZ2T8J1_9ENTE|nr:MULTISPECIES: peptide ABC transporter substrate-binding protein [unclassified Enterococcus]OTN88291.1 pheromone-binding protein [Enterococcus sp. 7E2_DIV0204]OTO70477.1 pheromone-binding protein [Enterococcus sp. 12C11_DIV0727]OTP48205.1 pheromone-binding protein [Enterococcus sp. 7D2_DIV0200]